MPGSAEHSKTKKTDAGWCCGREEAVKDSVGHHLAYKKGEKKGKIEHKHFFNIVFIYLISLNHNKL